MDLLMSLWVFFIGIIIGIIGGVILSYKTAVNPLHNTITNLTSKNIYSQETLKFYPYNLNNFRFIGHPIDGIQFEQNNILFVRLIKNNENRTREQDHIKKLLENRNIEWFEFPI